MPIGKSPRASSRRGMSTRSSVLSESPLTAPKEDEMLASETTSHRRSPRLRTVAPPRSPHSRTRPKSPQIRSAASRSPRSRPAAEDARKAIHEQLLPGRTLTTEEEAMQETLSLPSSSSLISSFVDDLPQSQQLVSEVPSRPSIPQEEKGLYVTDGTFFGDVIREIMI
mmetsp:Transcript_30133/g.77800  ORF Transcript_30133/g.77800 Transcript_30133/m.77800 type:complete len:168 (-) Transcript_30133:3150-3653(-)